MKITLIVLSALTALLIFSTVVCGLWLRYSGETVEQSAIMFHMMVGIGACLSAIVTIVISVSQLFKLMA